MTTAIPAAAARYGRPNMELAHALAEARLTGVPAYRVAMAANVSPSLLSMIVRGVARATDETRAAIAAALGRDQAELFPER